MEDSKEIKVMKMLAMRKLVRDHMTGKNPGNVKHLGELDLDKEDNTRLVISLQDFAEKLMGKLKRASQHLAAASETIDFYLGEDRRHIQQDRYYQEKLEMQARQIRDMTQASRNQDEEISRLRRQLEVFKELYEEAKASKEAKSKIPVPVEYGERTVSAATAAGPNPYFLGSRSHGKSTLMQALLNAGFTESGRFPK